MEANGLVMTICGVRPLLKAEGAGWRVRSYTRETDRSRSPTHKLEPYSYGGELDEGEAVGVVLFVHLAPSRKYLILLKKNFDEFSEAIRIGIGIGIGAEGEDVHPVQHWLLCFPMPTIRWRR